ncbi:hypothetical protein MCHI_002119 [Candidatus Magnetoovum chiemensis]|nr:hypothetical protein MCHI_002119 [Candidatus Magnetoovum chiemensis]
MRNGSYPDGCGYAVHDWHLHVHKHGVVAVFLHHLQGNCAVFGNLYNKAFVNKYFCGYLLI